MIMTCIRKIILFSVMAVIITVSAFGQESDGVTKAESAETSSALYFDVLFNEYIELETDVLEATESGAIDSEDLVRIDGLLQRAAEANRTDIVSRLNMLRFVAETGIAAIETDNNADTFLEEMSETEKKRRAALKVAEIGRTSAGIAIGTAAVAGTVFAVSSIMSQDYYYKYTQTDLNDQAAFYLFWWQFLDNISKGSALVTIIGSSTAGLLAAIF